MIIKTPENVHKICFKYLGGPLNVASKMTSLYFNLLMFSSFL